jgi:hypothetical protein
LCHFSGAPPIETYRGYTVWILSTDKGSYLTRQVGAGDTYTFFIEDGHSVTFAVENSLIGYGAYVCALRRFTFSKSIGEYTKGQIGSERCTRVYQPVVGRGAISKGDSVLSWPIYFDADSPQARLTHDPDVCKVREPSRLVSRGRSIDMAHTHARARAAVLAAHRPSVHLARSGHKAEPERCMPVRLVLPNVDQDCAPH